ncbi:helix-turn-helix transcriptional regulator [Blastococcus sp. URHD0036]|uniref:helix-turn-helix domain-containing protein n=1 Tax=Blastococcus sp. URHD0036 TaxID=1380356 RepID=UPI00054D1A3E|nr:helix-turn-helix transcriptional regulator [Blastococcus sp. URHD0036]
MRDVDVAGLLRRIRRTADLSQRDLAAALGVSKSAVGAAEAGTGRLDLRTLTRAAALAGLRLALVDGEGREVRAMADDAVRDSAGRRFPAHLDTRLSDDGWWHGPERYSRRQPTYSFDRDRRRRDASRSMTGVPDDHRQPGPGDSPAERAAARRDGIRRRQRAEWERRRDAGELEPIPAWVCDCPPGCTEDEAGVRQQHTDDCVCRCDLG